MWNDLSQRLIHGLADADTAADPFLQTAARKVAPTMAYGRHYGPAPRGARRAAVAVVWLQKDDGSWLLPLTLRPLSLRHHGGQICFPGGMIEGDETPVQAALREFEEELGHRPVDPIFCGSMKPMYVYASNNLIFPVVLTAQMPSADWSPDPAEVDRVIELPLETIDAIGGEGRDTRVRQIVRDQQVVGEYRFDSLAYRVGEDRIWGATAMLIQQLSRLVRQGEEQVQTCKMHSARLVFRS
jgi:8-oxo-dGTP pyrophosphatase MutT (NUDIX family)